jgi:hypothetical protein
MTNTVLMQLFFKLGDDSFGRTSDTSSSNDTPFGPDPFTLRNHQRCVLWNAGTQ